MYLNNKTKINWAEFIAGSLLGKAKNVALDILFPPVCLNCQKPIDDRNKLICRTCLSLIKFNNTLFCPVCRARLPENKKICHFNSQYLLAAAGNYDDPVLQNLIHYFKYKSFKNIAPILGEIALKYLQILNLNLKPFAVTPIPLHPKKERQRGFNQSKLLAEFLAKKLDLEFLDGLKRIKNTEPQVKIKDPEKRTENIKGCFEINPHTKREWSLSANDSSYSRYGVGVKNPIRGKNILLIDDVFTSGATISEAVKILKANGSGKIIALVVAKA